MKRFLVLPYLFYSIIFSLMMHNTIIQAESCVSCNYNESTLALQKVIGTFTSIAGISMISRGIFLALNIPYPYSLGVWDRTIIISINEKLSPTEKKRREKTRRKKGLILSAVGVLMALGGWFFLDSTYQKS